MKLLHEIHRRLIPAGGKPLHLHFLAVAVDQAVLFEAELQAALEIAVGGSERAFTRTRKLVRGINHIHGPLLELHRVASRGDRYTDQPPGHINVTVMIDSDLRDHVSGMSVS